MNSILEFKGVSAGYHGLPVIKDLTVSIREREIVGVLGPNGAGKTTLLRCITGLCRPLAGAIQLFDKDASQLDASERARLVAVVPQEVETPVAFTVQEIVMIGRTASLSRWSQPTKRDIGIVERAMVYTDVVDMRDRPFAELSGGEKQRTIVAMALAQEPRLILMDEATSHLDMNHRLEVMQIVERLNREQGVTVVMISHDLNLAAEFCQRLILMDHGQIVADGTPLEVLNEEILRRVYQCDVIVQRDPASGLVSVVPARRLTVGHCGRGLRAHVVAGGGCAEEILRRLSLCEYTVTCGVLNQGDSDAEFAEALGIETALEKPFSPIGQSARNSASEMAKKADFVVVCGVPFGPGNLVNLTLAEQAVAQSKRVFIMSGIEKRDYTSGHEATAKITALLEKGAVIWNTLPDLFNLVPVTKESKNSSITRQK
jgi:iron complex transport system ATP-binding protein